MAVRNLSAVLHGKMDLRMTQSCVPSPGYGEVLLQMECCGICGTDIHMWTHGKCGDFLIHNPIVMGHESSGVVMETGEGVHNLIKGDRVAVELCPPCRYCEFCKRGKYNLCKGFSYGALTRYFSYAADFCHKLPDNVGVEEGALVEPLAVGVRAGRRCGITLGSQVLVCGAGPIGLVSLLTAKAMGASEVCVTDVSSSRLELARKMGASHTVLVDTNDSQSVAAQIKDCLRDSPEFTIETSGAESSVRTAIYATRSGGVVAPVGLEPQEVVVPVVDAAVREVDIKGVFSYTSQDYKAAIKMISSGLADPKPMISHRFNLEQTLEACELVKRRSEGVVKVLVSCSSGY